MRGVKKTKITWRKVVKSILYWGAILFFVLWITNRAADIENIIQVIKDTNYSWIILAFVFQGIFILIVGWINYLALRVTGFRVRLREVIRAHLASLFLGLTTPLGAFGSAAFLARYYSKRSPVSLGGTALALFYAMVVFNIGFLIILVPSLYVLRESDSSIFLISLTAGSVFMLFTLIFALVVIFSSWKPITLKKIFFKLKRIYQKIGRINEDSLFTLKDDTLEKLLQDFIIGCKTLRSKSLSRETSEISALSIASHLWQLLVLASVFTALGVGFDLKVIALTYSVFYLFSVISPTPQGIGIVEGLVQVALVSLGVAGEASFVIVLIYRAISSWAPVLVGFLFFKKIGIDGDIAPVKYADNS